MKSRISLFMQFVSEIGGGEIGHYGASYIHHLRGVYDLLDEHGFPEHVCLAGAAHSIYGTDKFKMLVSPESRPSIRGLIGDDAEAIAYAHCAMLRTTLDAVFKWRPSLGDIEARWKYGGVILCDRFLNLFIQPCQSIDLKSSKMFVELCAVHFFDWIEQLPRMPIVNRRERESTYRIIGKHFGTEYLYEMAISPEIVSR